MVLFPSTYTIKRKASTGYVDTHGHYVAGSQSTFNVQADCQSLTAKELEVLNIGRKDLGKIKIFCDTELLICQQGINGTNLQNGDLITYLSEDYEIIQKQKFGNLIPHYEYIAELRK